MTENMPNDVHVLLKTSQLQTKHVHIFVMVVIA